MLEPTTSTPSPRKILDFHDTISKSTQDLGFFNNHTRVSRKLAGTFVVFQVLLLFTNASFTSQKFSERQNFGSIALHNSQNLEKKNIFFSSSQQHFQDLDRILTRFCVISQDFDLSYFCHNDALSVPV